MPSECHWAMSVNIVFGGDTWGGVVFAERKIVANLLFGCDGANGKLFWDSTEFLMRSVCMESSLSVFIHQDGVFLIRGGLWCSAL